MECRTLYSTGYQPANAGLRETRRPLGWPPG